MVGMRPNRPSHFDRVASILSTEEMDMGDEHHDDLGPRRADDDLGPRRRGESKLQCLKRWKRMRGYAYDAIAAGAGVARSTVIATFHGQRQNTRQSTYDGIARGLDMDPRDLDDLSDSTLPDRPHFDDSELPSLLRIASHGACAGGFTAMMAYREALVPIEPLSSQPNPSLSVDVAATRAILHAIDTDLENLLRRPTRNGATRAVYFAEELENQDHRTRDAMNAALSEIQLGGTVTRSSREFGKSLSARIGVLIDGLDGSINFRHGLPVFCSSVAILDGHTPRIGASYDPINHVVFGAYIAENGPNHADAWYVGTGRRAPLKDKRDPSRLIGTHITSKAGEKQSNALEILAKLTESPKVDRIYITNSGQTSLSWVASGSLAGFVQTRTSIWDVAAGEVLITALGGKVTDFWGDRIDYSDVESGSTTNVVAARDPEVHDHLLKLVEEFQSPPPSKTHIPMPPLDRRDQMRPPSR